MIFILSYYLIFSLNLFIVFGMFIFNRFKFSISSSYLIFFFLLLLTLNDISLNDWWFILNNNVIYYIVLFSLFSLLWLQVLIKNLPTFEIIIFLLLIIISSLILIITYDLILWFISFEIISLSSYALISIERNSVKNLEASLKYFTLGSLASAFYLLGITIYFGITNSFNMYLITFFSYSEINIFLLVLVLFKLGLAPLHEWIADIYSGTSLTIASLLATIVKFSLSIWFFNWISCLQLEFNSNLMIILLFCCILSWFIGYLGALNQSILTRFFAYSSIANIAWILIPLILSKNIIAIEYLIIYTTTLMLLFSITLSFKVNTNINKNIVYLIDLSGIHIYSIGLCISLIIALFSSIGLPPLAGFWIKYNVLFSILNFDLILLSLFAVLCSLIGTFAYLRLITISTNLTNNFFGNTILYLLTSRIESTTINLSILTSITIWIIFSYCLINNIISILFI